MIKQFADNRSGATAILFALVLFTVFMACGVAIDYGRLYMAKTELQSRADIAALRAANSTAKTEIDLLTEARKQLVQPEVMRYTSGASPSDLKFTNEDETKFMLKVPGHLDMTLMKVFGYDKIDITVATEVERAQPGALELALVLDNTESMKTVMPDGKSRLDALKSSATSLIKSVGLDPKADVKIAVVPFVDYVNVGTDKRGSSWLTVPDDSTTTGEEVCKDVQKYKNINCVKMTGTRVRDGVTETYTYNQCDKVPDKIVYECTKPVTKKIWNGCVGTRAAPNQVEPDLKGGGTYPGLQNISCANAITPLTSNNGAAQSAISTMKAVNSTYIPAGLLWGINVLTPEAPYTEARPFDTKLGNFDPRKVIVLMTDGENTKSLKQPYHNGSSQSDADAYTTATCNKAKALGIEVFTVAFAVSSMSTKSMLLDCATDAGHYYDATSSAALADAFADIGASLKVVRISR